MTSPAMPPTAPARFTPAITPGRRVAAVLASSAAVALAAMFVALLAFFIGSGQSPQVLGEVFGHFALAAFVAWVLLSVANAVGATRAWFLTLITGFTSGCLAALIATTVTASAVGNPFSGAIFLFVIGSLVSLNLIFILSVIVGEMLLAPAVFRGILAYAPEAVDRRIALVRIPASNLDEAVLTHRDRQPIDQALADQQWDNYCAALVAEGWETIEVDAAPELADSVFVEDMVVMFGDLAVLASPGAESRRPEVEAVERAVREVPGLTVTSDRVPSPWRRGRASRTPGSRARPSGAARPRACCPSRPGSSPGRGILPAGP